jgi:hypothetical protein
MLLDQAYCRFGKFAKILAACNTDGYISTIGESVLTHKKPNEIAGDFMCNNSYH